MDEQERWRREWMDISNNGEEWLRGTPGERKWRQDIEKNESKIIKITGAIVKLKCEWVIKNIVGGRCQPVLMQWFLGLPFL